MIYIYLTNRFYRYSIHYIMSYEIFFDCLLKDKRSYISYFRAINNYTIVGH